VSLKKSRFGDLLEKMEISLYERYPVPDDAKMSDDGVYIIFPPGPDTE
jgi:hypothetical protein